MANVYTITTTNTPTTINSAWYPTNLTSVLYPVNGITTTAISPISVTPSSVYSQIYTSTGLNYNILPLTITVNTESRTFNEEEIKIILKDYMIVQHLIKEQPLVKDTYDELQMVIKLCYNDDEPKE